MAKLHVLREDYELGELLESIIDADPIEQFKHWMNDAIEHKQKEPNAMVLSTIDEKGAPSSRVVLVKEIDSNGIVFYTNYNSDKASHINKKPSVALNFNWLDLQRQVRMEGHVEKIDAERATTYFQSRPKSSQIGAWVSEQSKIIASREILENAKLVLEEKYKDVEVLPKPPHWGGYKVVPHQIEFWQGRRSRLHDRLRYIKLKNNNWDIVRVSP